MFNKNKNNLKKVLAPIEKMAGERIRKFAKDVQADAWSVAYLAYLEGKDVHLALTMWNRKERAYKKKILAFTRARPLAREKEQLKQIQKDYR